MSKKIIHSDIDASTAFHNLLSLQQFSVTTSLRQLLVLSKNIGSNDRTKALLVKE